MIFLEIYPNKNLKKPKDEETFITENLISSFHIKLPSTFGDYKTSDLECEMRVYLPTGDYMAYDVPTSSSCQEVPITNDITGTVQTVKIMFIFSKNGNVIGKTNSIEKQILDAPIKGEPLTPREQFDTVIAEQRETIEEQGQAITEQQSTITEQSSQITELNGEVTELQGEVAEQQATITRQNTTIDELNRRVPPLETLDPINPTTEQVTYNPESPNIGFPQVIVNAPTAEGLGFREDYYKKDEIFLNKVGTYDPFPEHSVGGIYITEVDEDGYPVKFLIKNYERTLNTFPIFFYKGTNAVRALEEVIFENCPNIKKLANNYFSNLTYLKRLILPSGLVELCSTMCQNCSSLTTIEIPAGVTRIQIDALLGTSIVQLNIPHGVEYIYNLPIHTLKILHLPNTLTSIGATGGYFFYGVTSIEHLYLENGYNLDSAGLFSAQRKLVAEDIVGCLNALKDRTGETAYTFGIGTTNANKLTAEQIAIATNKNWNLA